MIIDRYDKTVYDVLHNGLTNIEEIFGADALFYYGEFDHRLGIVKRFTDAIEQLKKDEQTKDRIVILLNTQGGSVEVVEKLVEIIRFHYKEVYFVIPDVAFSAGTIFCMSGDKIYMDYSSALGPIDPQVFSIKENRYVPALGYLDKVGELIEKSRVGDMTQVEFSYFQGLDLAFLKSCDQAKELAVTLLEKWLVDYKFKDWNVHKTNPDKKGMPVTEQEKIVRAKEIATSLSNNNAWHSHGRHIGIKTLQTKLKLEIDDYSNNEKYRLPIRDYNDIMIGLIIRNRYPSFIHTRHFLYE
ncbi:MAG: ATP-dependent Clp protease proteolytic subunit [Nitrospirae bacterium]|nr:ATP-dependent Clp protease proteolytic subunit [Nitrospirota bacterium]